MPNSYTPVDGLYRILAEPQLDMDSFGRCGDVIRSKANIALNYGDVVHLISGTANQVTKTVTGADHLRVMGVVVGGKKTYMQILTDPAAAGVVQCAAAGEQVLVLVSGITDVVLGGTVTEGQSIIPDTGTAGRVIAGTTSGSKLGKLLVGGTVGLTRLALVAIS